jgi:hypothetical protein
MGRLSMLPTGPVLAVMPAAAVMPAPCEGDCTVTGNALLLLAPEAAMVNEEPPLKPAAAAAWAPVPPTDSRAAPGSGCDMAVAVCCACWPGLW